MSYDLSEMAALPENPYILFLDWYQRVQEEDYVEPTAMTVATATADGRPSVRVLLLKGVDERGFVFYSNMTSRKGKELHANPYAALCFYWDTLGKQVRIEGKVDVVSDHEADTYFAERKRSSQIGAWASHQSQILPTRDTLEMRLQEVEEQFKDSIVTRPPFWTGYRVVPTDMEFWQVGESRLHHRAHYHLHKTGWEITALYP